MDATRELLDAGTFHEATVEEVAAASHSLYVSQPEAVASVIKSAAPAM